MFMDLLVGIGALFIVLVGFMISDALHSWRLDWQQQEQQEHEQELDRRRDS